MLIFQAAYLLMDWCWADTASTAILPLHLFNLLIASIFLSLTYLPAFPERMPHCVLGGCTLIFAATAALSILTLNRAPLTLSVTITMVGAAALVPWDWRWQAGLTLAGAGSMAALTLLRPQSDPHLGYDWLAVVSAAGVGHFVSISVQRYRWEIAHRIMALQVNHRRLLEESEAREAVATANERVRQQLGESETKLRKIFETTDDVITINRLSDGRYIDVNGAFWAAYGYTREETLAASASELGVWAVRAQLREFVKAIAAHGAVANMEMDARAKDGSIEPYLVSAKVIELNGERCVVTIARNISSIKQTEAALIGAREAALAASRAKSEFLSSMSHEIRTPMNAILGMAQLLEETPLNPEQKKYLEIMTSNGDALLELINSILDLAKIESGRLALEQAGFDLESSGRWNRRDLECSRTSEGTRTAGSRDARRSHPARRRSAAPRPNSAQSARQRDQIH